MMINVKVNNQSHQFKKESTLQFVLDELCIQVYGIAVAINEQVISKEDWSRTQLQNNDTILIIKATQGG